MLRLTPDSLTVESFSIQSAEIAANTGIECTHFRDCTYPPMCPADTTQEAVVLARPRTFEPGCTLPEICGG